MKKEIFDGIKVVLWDIDGTVLNFYEAQKNAINVLFSKFELGKCTDAMLEDYDQINHKYWESLERGEISKAQVLTGRFYEFFEKYGLDTRKVNEFNENYQVRLGDTICFYSGVKEVLYDLKRKGIIQFAVTNGTKIAQERKLANSGLDKIFDGIFISEDVGFEKPNPYFFKPIYLRIIEECGEVDLSEILIIGDSLTSDIQFGKNIGIKTCWVNHQSQSKKSKLDADFEIVDFL